MTLSRWLFSPLLALSFASPLSAQTDSLRGAAVYVGGGVSQYDLSGTGTAGLFAVRVDWAVIRPFILTEIGASVARVTQSGDESWLMVPEAQIQGQLTRGNFRPYLGVGLGVSIDARSENFGGVDTEPTLSAAAGFRLWFKRRVGARAELRVRGIGERFQGSTAEWSGGITWRM